MRTLAEGHLPAWSPDGRHIAFVRGPRLHVVEAAGGEVRQLAVGMVLSGVRARALPGHPTARASRSPGAMTTATGSRARRRSTSCATDGATTQLTRGGGAKADPRFAPDGRTIVFAENHPTEPRIELVLVEADGSNRRSLTRGARFSYDQSAAWSPDGAWVAFTRGSAETVRADVLVVRRDGTGLRRLTQPRSGLPAYESPGWLPDGRAVVFARASADRDHDLFTVDPRNGHLRRLTDNLVQDRDPAWSPDGRGMAFVRTLVASGSRRSRTRSSS